jgi:hypothetical protein
MVEVDKSDLMGGDESRSTIARQCHDTFEHIRSLR